MVMPKTAWSQPDMVAYHESRFLASISEAMANRALANLRSALLGERPQDLVNPQVFKD